MAKILPYDEELVPKAQAAMSMCNSADADASGIPSLDNGMQQILSALSAAKDPSLDSSLDSPESMKLWEMTQDANRRVWSEEWRPSWNLQFQNQLQNLHSLSINPMTL